MGLTDELKSRARELGFVAVGVTGAEPFREAQQAAVERTERGLMDGLSWWSLKRAEASAEPRRQTPQAQSVVALAFPHPVPNNDLLPDDGPRGRVAAYALGRDYHELLEERMAPLRDLLPERAPGKTYVDHGWMLDRAAAARAGLGWLGKNTNLLVPGHGSYVLLAEIVTAAELDLDQPLKKTCGSCDACLRVCPTGALVAPGVLDNRRCIAFWTIEHKGAIPLEVRPLLSDWVFGCDLCQEVCPINRSASAPDPVVLTAYRALSSHRPLLEELLSLDETAFAVRFRGTAIWRTRRPRLLRNVCVALGNIGDRDSVPVLAQALLDAQALIRGHSAWALGRIGGAAARRHLEAALKTEADGWVRAELEMARDACGWLVFQSPASTLPPPPTGPA